MKSPRHHLVVLGPGAVGGLLVAVLTRCGTEVIAVGREDAIARIDREGLVLRSNLLGDWSGSPRTAVELPPGADVVLAIKAFALPAVLDQLAAARPRSVLTVLNGIGHVSAIRSVLPGTRVIPATIKVEVARTGSAIEHLSPFLSVCVPDAYLAEPAVRAIAQAGVDVHPGGSEVEVLWTKFRFLAPMAMLTALHQAPIGEAMRRDPELTARLVAESALAATTAGLATTPSELTAILEELPEMMRSSLQQDLAAGRASELEAVAGSFVDFSSYAGIRVPASAAVADILRSRSV